MCNILCCACILLEGHRCSVNGCGSALVLDGNMKNHRDVCAAQEAGYAEFNGLSGKVKTGCPNTPQLKSRYCPAHAPTAFNSDPAGIDDDSGIKPLNSSLQRKEAQLAYIVGKRETRNSTLYQVQLSYM